MHGVSGYLQLLVVAPVLHNQCKAWSMQLQQVQARKPLLQ
jgi:hypothetical protein